MLNDVLVLMVRGGNNVTIIPIHPEFATQEVATFLNVSRPCLIQQLETEQIHFHKLGSHRRIGLNDRVEYNKESMADAEVALSDLASDAKEMGLY